MGQLFSQSHIYLYFTLPADFCQSVAHEITICCQSRDHKIGFLIYRTHRRLGSGVWVIFVASIPWFNNFYNQWRFMYTFTKVFRWTRGLVKTSELILCMSSFDIWGLRDSHSGKFIWAIFTSAWVFMAHAHCRDSLSNSTRTASAWPPSSLSTFLYSTPIRR